MLNIGATILGFIALSQAVPTDPSTLDKRVKNGVGLTPAMGWNNYNAFTGSGSSATRALEAANYFVSLGLSSVGYQYVTVDDTWSKLSRDSSGNLVPDSGKWPNGIKSVADTIHGMGLKFGLYGDSGTKTCSGYPGSQGYETQDAKQLAAWGVDYWKYDNCATPSSGTSQTRYTTMSNALQSSGRSILFAMCSWGADSVWTWGAGVGNSWRTTGDVTDTWSSVVSIAKYNGALASYPQPGGFNDWDMLEVGNGGLTTAEERAHFGLWALGKSPLILGNDLTKISATSLAIIKNTGVIAINQDSLGKAAAPFTPSGASASSGLSQYWAGALSDGHVIGLVAVNGAATLTVKFSDVSGLGSGTYSWKELYTGATGSGTSVSATLSSHDMAIYKVTTGSSGTTPVTTPSKAGSSPTPSASKPSATPATGNTVTAVHYGQCGGASWTGSTTCESPYTCKLSSQYYSQCL